VRVYTLGSESPAPGLLPIDDESHRRAISRT
jgi:hypothetical protein